MSITTLIDFDNGILNVLRYYSVFNYPITIEEVYGNCKIPCQLEELYEIMHDLRNRGEVFEFRGFYSISKEIVKDVERRLEGNAMAIEKEKGARVCARIINFFPVVRFVGISGSLSKGYSEKESDYDFFVVTKGNRLWITRTTLHVFKKLTFIVGKQHCFCMNYFIDEMALQIDEKNIFTAVELASMIPVYGTMTYKALLKANSWADAYFPNGFRRFSASGPIYDRRSVIKIFTEFLFNIVFPNSVNNWLMKITDKRWRNKWEHKKYPPEDYDLAFKTTLHVSKNHPRNHQKRTLSLLNKLMREAK